MELSIDTEPFVLGKLSTAFSEIFQKNSPEILQKLSGEIPLELFGRGSRDSARKKVEKSLRKIWSVPKKVVSLHYQKRKKQTHKQIITH